MRAAGRCCAGLLLLQGCLLSTFCARLRLLGTVNGQLWSPPAQYQANPKRCGAHPTRALASTAAIAACAAACSTGDQLPMVSRMSPGVRLVGGGGGGGSPRWMARLDRKAARLLWATEACCLLPSDATAGVLPSDATAGALHLSHSAASKPQQACRRHIEASDPACAGHWRHAPSSRSRPPTAATRRRISAKSMTAFVRVPSISV